MITNSNINDTYTQLIILTYMTLFGGTRIVNHRSRPKPRTPHGRRLASLPDTGPLYLSSKRPPRLTPLGEVQKVTIGRGDLSVCPLGGFIRAQESLISN